MKKGNRSLLLLELVMMIGVYHGLQRSWAEMMITIIS